MAVQGGKNVLRGTRREQKARHKQYKPWKAFWAIPLYKASIRNEWPARIFYRGYNEGRCRCWNELPKGFCTRCDKYIRFKAGEPGLEDSWDLFEDDYSWKVVE